MRKLLLILWAISEALNSYSTVRYVSTTGNDISGTGSNLNPYASLFKACSVSVSGDVVHVKSGNYIQNAQQVIVQVGVSIEGEGAWATKITLTYTLTGPGGFNSAAIQLLSTTPNTFGNQSISNIWFDGNNFQCYSGVLVRARGGVTFSRVKFTNFGIMGLSLYGKTGQATGQPPAQFADGNQVLNCMFLDCNDRTIQAANSISAGSIAYAGQSNLLFLNDTTRNINKAQGHNGDLYGAVQGNNKGVKWLNCIFEKPRDEGTGFNFSIESWYDMGGCEIANCTFIGGGDHVDIGYGGANKGTYPYSWYIHDNNVYNTSLLTSSPSWPTPSIFVQFEPSTNTSLAPINTTIGDAIIQNNHLNYIGNLVQITLGNNAADFVDNIQIDHNDCRNTGYFNNTYSGVITASISNGTRISNVNIWSNTIQAAKGPGASKAIIILMPNVGTIKKFSILNNILDSATGYGYLVFRGNNACDSIDSKNNITNGNAFTNNPFVFTSPAAPSPTHFTNTNNLKLDPQFVSSSDFHLKPTSPAIGNGLNPPADYIGAFPATATNVAPTADAGGDQIIQLPVSSVSLFGSGTDVDGTIVSYAWTQVSGTGGSITNPSSASTTITGLSAGIYQFKITVTDNGGLTGSDIMTVTVTAANIAPTANAGTDQAIQLPTSSTTLTGSANDPDGTINGYAWTRISGPNTPTIVSPTSATTSITGLIAGTYVFRLTVTDNLDLTGFDEMTVIVSASANVAPTANAGIDQSIQLPTNSVNLVGSGNDPDGSIVSYLWTQIAGAAATITSPSSSSTSVTGLSTTGVYQFKLTVTDNGGLTGSDNMIVTVTAANIPPQVNAGTDQSITSPTSSITFAGSALDADGSITSHTWTKISGTGGTITTPLSYTSTVTGLSPGTYVFRLTATDNQSLSGFDEMTVTVNAANPVPPVADAGIDQTITWPTNSVTLSGGGTDADGTITGYGWIKLSGGTGTITNSGSASTTVTGLSVGVYQFQLTVIDNSGQTATDIMQVTVNKGNLTINVTGTSVIFNNSNQLPTVTTTPSGIAYSITLNGLAGGQSQVGSYNYVVGITDPNWNFTPATGTFTITKATATISASNQTFNFDGLTHSIPGTTTPAGLTVLSYTYNGSGTAPSAIGVYDEAIILTNSNYQATTIHVTLTIVSNAAPIYISDTDFIYDGTAKNVTVTSGFPYSLVGSPRTIVGTNQVIATITSGATGADTANITIHPKPAVLSWTQSPPQPFGSMLTPLILSAVADVPGTWSYNHVLGETLPLGPTNVIGTFVPSSSNYTGGTISVTINVYAVNPFNGGILIIGPGGVIYIEQ